MMLPPKALRAPLALISGLMLVAGLVTGAGVATEAGAATGPEPRAIRVDGVDRALADRLEREGLDVAYRGEGFVEALADAADFERLTSLGLRWEPLERDLFPGAREGSREGNLDPQYHTFAEMLAEMQALAAAYPDICRLYDIGDAESRHWDWTNYAHDYDLWALRISDNPDLEEPEPCIVYDGRHHAREPVATEIVLAVAEYFCQHYGSDPEITFLVDESEIWCVPMVNPDGHQWVEDVDVWWRKTLWDHDQDHLVESYEGIDPNRNYDWHWILEPWDSEVYGGPFAWSAVEVATMRDMLVAHRPAINPSFHSYGREVLYPFGYGVQPEPAVTEIGGQYASQIGYNLYQSTTANGSSKDWAYGALGSVSFTVETATTFIPSGTAMEAEVAQLLPGSLWLAERLHGASVRGVVVDSLIGIPLAATIHIPEIQGVYGGGELRDTETEAATGFFCRMRPQASGTITLQVSAEGYHDKSLQVTTGGTTPTEVAIELVPLSADNGVLAGTVTNATAGGAPLAGATIAVLPGGPSFLTGTTGGFVGYVPPGTYTIEASHPSFAAESVPGVLITIGETTVVDFALADIAPPEIAGTTDYPSTSDPAGPYPVGTTITDASGLAEAWLYYRVDGGGFSGLALAPQGQSHYRADIPGQPFGSLVEYYVYARDPGDNDATDPAGAPAQLFDFRVAPEVVLFSDAIESGSPDWTHGVVTPGFIDQWHISTELNHTPGGLRSWKCGDTGSGTYANLLDAGLVTPLFELAEQSRLVFWHWIDAETSSAYPGQAYDGGLLEISTDGETWTQIAPEGGYSHICRVGGSPGPFPAGTPIFSGTHGWEEVEFDLGAHTGLARVRFRFGSDGGVAREGWYIDDVVVRGLETASETPLEEIAALAPRAALWCAPSLLSPGRSAQVHYRLPQPARVGLEVIDASGRLVRAIPGGEGVSSAQLSWDGRGASGARVPSGVYWLRLRSLQGETIDGAPARLVVLD